ncbi:cysteine hydrolase family protein [Chitinophaga sp. HK235]|uniref:cysteine hydrolase family protein n=1 Tax=Chitinophaga sp. HK235 TaxID=2952571 RepID=UPI001BA8D706|nr:isochorismatase family cysteine hydrolase [Chitinophaga sp. HK235]
MKRERIIIIDAQKDFVNPEGAYAQKHPGITQILDAKNRINNLLESLDKELFVIIRADYKPDQFENGVSMCIPNTPGHEIDIKADECFNMFTKTEHSAFSSEAFKEYAGANEIETLILTGFLAEYCVKQTALDALNAGYHVYLLEDCIGTGDDVQIRKELTLSELEQKGAKILNSRELLRIIK